MHVYVPLASDLIFRLYLQELLQHQDCQFPTWTCWHTFAATEIRSCFIPWVSLELQYYLCLLLQLVSARAWKDYQRALLKMTNPAEVLLFVVCEKRNKLVKYLIQYLFVMNLFLRLVPCGTFLLTLLLKCYCSCATTTTTISHTLVFGFCGGSDFAFPFAGRPL